MTKIVTIGDIHGRDVWKDIIEKEKPDQVIFLGDYLSTHEENITSEMQVDNLKEIFKYKDEHPNTIMLRGNHDLQHLGYYWARCSGYFPNVDVLMRDLKQEYLDKTQWLYIVGNTLFSHAGVSKVWLREEMKIDPDNLTDDILNDINKLEPSEKFGFTSRDRWDIYGESPYQPLTWIRPNTLVDVMIPGYNQVVGHTTMGRVFNARKAEKLDNDLWLCDALGHGWYLVGVDGKYEAKCLWKNINNKNE